MMDATTKGVVYSVKRSHSKCWGLCGLFLIILLQLIVIGVLVAYVWALSADGEDDIDIVCPGSKIWLFVLLCGLTPLFICCANCCCMMPVVICCTPAPTRGRALSKCQRVLYSLLLLGYSQPLAVWGWNELETDDQSDCVQANFELLYAVAWGEFVVLAGSVVLMLGAQVYMAIAVDNKKLTQLMGFYTEAGLQKILEETHERDYHELPAGRAAEKKEDQQPAASIISQEEVVLVVNEE